MKRIIIHWTGGTGQPNNLEYNDYHFMVNKNGLIVKGKYEPEDNENCDDGIYAKHTGGGNTGSIGVAVCGMLNYVGGKPDSTKYPLNQTQCEACWKLVAELCKKYHIQITPLTVLTHYEFGIANPRTTSYRKPDISYLHYKPELKPFQIGDYIRNKIKWYLSRI